MRQESERDGIGAAPRVFPGWLSRRVPILAELEANPLYLFLTGQAYGRRRWWLLGRRAGRFRLGRAQWVRSILVIAVLLLFGSMLLTGVFPGILFMLLLVGVVGTFFSVRTGASIESFLVEEHRAGRLGALRLTPLTSRDWALGWVGARLLRRPGLILSLLAGGFVFWPVFAVLFRGTLRQALFTDSFASLVFYPALVIPGFAMVAAFYRMGSEVLVLYFDLSDMVRPLSAGERVAASIGNSLGGTLYAAFAWAFPIIYGVLGAKPAGWCVRPLFGPARDAWEPPIVFTVFVVCYVAGSCLGQWAVARAYWHAVQRLMLPSIEQRAIRLE